MTPTSRLPVGSGVLLALGLAWLFGAPGLLAQTPSPAAVSPQMRHFWHVFAAYAIAWLLIFGWVLAIARRLKRAEARLDTMR